MERNSFKDLEKEMLNEHGAPPKKTFTNVSHSISVFKLLGDMLDLFFPKMVDLFVKMSGGGPRQNVSNKFDLNENGSIKRPKYPNK